MRKSTVLASAILLLIITQTITVLIRTHFSQLILFNRAAFFGLVNSPVGVLLVVMAGFLLFWQVFQNSTPTQFAQWGAVLVIVGALSNVIDRLLYGAVIDYIPLLNFSTFNLADVQIILGALLLSFSPSDKK